jgi:hypothetical protein
LIDQNELLNLLNRPRTKYWIHDLAIEVLYEDFVLTDLLDLTIHPDGQTAFHAVWLLDTVVLLDLPRFAMEIDLFISFSQQIKHHSCQRHYARIFMFFTGCKDPLIKLNLQKLIWNRWWSAVSTG